MFKKKTSEKTLRAFVFPDLQVRNWENLRSADELQ